MLARNPVVAVAFAVVAAGASASLEGCTPRVVACQRGCPEGAACVAGECLRAGAVPEVEGLDKFGSYQARRLVIAPVDVVRLASSDTDRASASRVATLGRARDASAVLLLRFAVDLPPAATILEADLVLQRASPFDADPTPVLLHAARILDPWNGGAIAWGRAPRLEEAGGPVTAIDDARRSVRIDVRPLVRRWRSHAPDDQGIALLADRASVTGIAFVLADGEGGGDANFPVLSVRGSKDAPPPFHGGAEDATVEPARSQGPRLELYVKP